MPENINVEFHHLFDYNQNNLYKNLCLIVKIKNVSPLILSMPKYNFALILEKETEKEIIKLAKKINKELDTEFTFNGKLNPHITIIKFETDKNDLILKKIEKLKTPIEIQLAGLTLLPSENGRGTWVEISVLNSENLRDLQNKFLPFIKKGEIISGIKENFRPHLTISKSKNSDNLKIKELDYKILRKKTRAFPRLIRY